jgi:hypothetical protein
MAIDSQPSNKPMPYSGPPPGYYPRVVPTSGMAVASLVCSLLGLITFGLGSIPGVFCGLQALPETRSGERGGHGLAIAGLIIGWIQFGGWALFWLFWTLGSSMH